ncbi:MAG: beta-class carbonic anhydrase [Promethearchaeota archaeon]
MENLESVPDKKNIPKYPVLIITCMDPRIDVFKIFQLNPGDLFVFRNAGNVYTNDMLRSILVTIVEFNIKYIIVLGHLDCGMTKITLKEFREKLPTEFLSQLSKNYYAVLTELNKFFKPFNNELENVKRQIKTLETIKSLYPKIEITGMIFDTKTGLVFEDDLFKDYDLVENFERIYKNMITQKKDQFADYLIKNKSEIISSNEFKNVPKEQELGEKDLSPPLNIEQRLNDSNIYKQEVSRESITKLIMPKISIPKIQFHKVKIYIPEIVKKKFNVS